MSGTGRAGRLLCSLFYSSSACDNARSKILAQQACKLLSVDFAAGVPVELQLFGIDLASLVNTQGKEFFLSDYGVGGGLNAAGNQPAQTTEEVSHSLYQADTPLIFDTCSPGSVSKTLGEKLVTCPAHML